MRAVAIVAIPMALLAFVLFFFRESVVEAVGVIWAIFLVGGLLAAIFLGLSSFNFAGFRLPRSIERMRTTAYLSVQLLPVIVFLLSGLGMFAFGWLPILVLMAITSVSAGLYLRGGDVDR